MFLDVDIIIFFLQLSNHCANELTKFANLDRNFIILPFDIVIFSRRYFQNFFEGYAVSPTILNILFQNFDQMFEDFHEISTQLF